MTTQDSPGITLRGSPGVERVPLPCTARSTKRPPPSPRHDHLREVACECMRVDISVDESFYRIVDAAMALTGSPKENLQVLDREVGTLKIAAQRGFESLFFRSLRKCATTPPRALPVCVRTSRSSFTT
jgi:hypothetical protein